MFTSYELSEQDFSNEISFKMLWTNFIFSSIAQLGMQHMYELGELIRARYSTFINKSYSVFEVRTFVIPAVLLKSMC